MKNPDEVVFPSGYRILIVLRIQKSRSRIAFTQLDNILVYLVDGPSIETSARKTPDARIVNLTHVDSF